MTVTEETIELSLDSAEKVAGNLRDLLIGKPLSIEDHTGTVTSGRLMRSSDHDEVELFWGSYQNVTIWLYLPGCHHGFSANNTQSAQFTFHAHGVTINYVTPSGNNRLIKLTVID